MASIFNDPEYGSFMNIDATVGRTGVNNRYDVMLVQTLMLQYFLLNGPVKFSFNTNGIFDKGTWQGLEKYKEIKNGKDRRFAEASRQNVYFHDHINPIRGSIFAFGTKKYWTIIQLQCDISAGMFHLDQEISLGFALNFEKRLEMAYELSPELKEVMSIVI